MCPAYDNVQRPFLLRAGLTGTYFYLYTYGGPVSIVWGWLLVSTANLLLGLVLAEICSSYPTSGGVYFWAHRLAGESDMACGLRASRS